MTARVDRFGAVASTLCAAHCAISALLPVALGATGLGFLLGHEAEWAFTAVATVFASSALVLGWRRHRSRHVAGLLGLGIIGLLASRGLEMGSAHHGHEGEHHRGASDHGAAAPGQGRAHPGSAARADTPEGAAPDEQDAAHIDGDDHEHPSHGAHEGIGHAVGTWVGVLAGLLLVFGHMSNLRLGRRPREECCE